MTNTFHNRNCIEVLKELPDNCIDLFNEDLPYNVTKNSYEYDVNLEEYWTERLRVAKPNAIFLLTGIQPFTSRLLMSNPKMFKYAAIWEKTTPTNFLNAKKQLLRIHEDLLVFYAQKGTYNPQKLTGQRRKVSTSNHKRRSHLTENYGVYEKVGYDSTERYPNTILKFATDKQKSAIHPNQKPVNLYRYLIRTYSNPSDVVFDGYAGSGTTARACIAEKRQYICCEWHPTAPHDKFFKAAVQSVNKKHDLITLF